MIGPTSGRRKDSCRVYRVSNNDCDAGCRHHGTFAGARARTAGQAAAQQGAISRGSAIYYPGFTLGGIAEFASVVAAVTLLILTPRNSPQFWLISAALAALVAVQVIFWTMTQPVNKYWLQNTELSRVATRFFQTSSAVPAGDWTVMRDRWERSHVLRALPPC
jgi:Domain of unknown function (DUF1772)